MISGPEATRRSSSISSRAITTNACRGSPPPPRNCFQWFHHSVSWQILPPLIHSVVREVSTLPEFSSVLSDRQVKSSVCRENKNGREHGLPGPALFPPLRIRSRKSSDELLDCLRIPGAADRRAAAHPGTPLKRGFRLLLRREHSSGISFPVSFMVATYPVRSSGGMRFTRNCFGFEKMP